jgi:hypothetical protein
MHRECQHFQRFAILYPEQLQQLMETTDKLFGSTEARQSIAEHGIDESIERDYWEAYVKLSDLVDVNDDPKVLTNGGQDIPYGEANPAILSG